MDMETLNEIRRLFREGVRGRPNLEKDIQAAIGRGVKQKVTKTLKDTDQLLDKWRAAVEDRLSTPIPLKYYKRARPSGRFFPYTNSNMRGNGGSPRLKDSIKAHANMWAVPRSKGVKSSYGIALSVSIGTPQAVYTTLGYAQRKDGILPKWIAWVENVFTGKGIAGQTQSVKGIFDIITERLSTQKKV